MIKIEIPMKLESLGNISSHWSRKYRIKKFQRNTIRSYLNYIEKPQPPWIIRLTRGGPRVLDADNLVASYKFSQDCISDFLCPGLPPGIADSHPDMHFEYFQEKSKAYFLRIEFL